MTELEINEQMYVCDELSLNVDQEVYRMNDHWMNDDENVMTNGPERIVSGARVRENSSTISFTVTGGSIVKSEKNQTWFTPGSFVKATITPSANLLSAFSGHFEEVNVVINGNNYCLTKLGKVVSNTWVPTELEFNVSNDNRITIWWDHTTTVENFRISPLR